MLCIDDFSRMTWVLFLKNKDEALDMFKSFNNIVENEIGERIKCLRSDRGGEFVNKDFDKFCETNGIRRQFSTTRTS